jgi:DNA-binding CsgD family transcriptional regulator
MHEGLHSLSGREVEVLRLLVTGHDAKSVARELGLSVHTVNDRLRDARRKLGVSSSREAARLLATAEQQRAKFSAPKKFGEPGGAQATWTPKNLGSGHDFHADKKMGLAGGALGTDSEGAIRRKAMRSPFAWLGGGVVLMSIIVAALGVPPVFRNAGSGTSAPASAAAQPEIDVMPLADVDRDGRVSADEYDAFSRQGWRFASKGRDRVRWAELDAMARVGMLGIVPDAQGVITRQMYIDAIPGRFKMFDKDGDGVLSADEINGRAFQN